MKALPGAFQGFQANSAWLVATFGALIVVVQSLAQTTPQFVVPRQGVKEPSFALATLGPSRGHMGYCPLSQYIEVQYWHHLQKKLCTIAASLRSRESLRFVQNVAHDES